MLYCDIIFHFVIKMWALRAFALEKNALYISQTNVPFKLVIELFCISELFYCLN